MLRSILGLVAGVFAAVAVVFGMEMIGMQIYAPPSGLDPNGPASIATAVASAPLDAKILIVAGCLGGIWPAARPRPKTAQGRSGF